MQSFPLLGIYCRPSLCGNAMEFQCPHAVQPHFPDARTDFRASVPLRIIFFCWLVLNPSSKRTAIMAGIALGAAIWSRGNAFMYLAMPLAGFVLVAVLRFAWPKHRFNMQVFVGFAVMALTCSAMAAVYFYFTHHSIYSYYLNHATSLQFDSARKLAGAKSIFSTCRALPLQVNGCLPTWRERLTTR